MASSRPLLPPADDGDGAPGDGAARKAPAAAKKPRLESLDAARGLTIMTMTVSYTHLTLPTKA